MSKMSELDAELFNREHDNTHQSAIEILDEYINTLRLEQMRLGNKLKRNTDEHTHYGLVGAINAVENKIRLVDAEIIKLMKC